MFGEYDLQDLVIQRIMSFKTNKNKSEEEKKKAIQNCKDKFKFGSIIQNIKRKK